MSDSTATRIYFAGGDFVRISEDVSEIVDTLSDGSASEWVYASDPADGRQKAIRTPPILWVEDEAAD